MSSARRHRIARAQILQSPLVRHTNQDEAEAVSLPVLWMCELPEIHISSSLQELPQSLETFFFLSLSLYFWSVILHCSCSVSSASHFLWHCLQTNCDVAGVEQKQFQILRGIFTRWVRLVGGGFCNKANLLSFTSTSNDHNRHESVNFSA